MKKRITKCLSFLIVCILVLMNLGYMGEIQAFAKQKSNKKVIVLEQKNVSTYVGGKVNVKVKTIKNAKKAKVSYKTSNAKIATVSSKGVVKGKKAGIAKITVSLKEDKKVKAVCKVKVYAATKKLTLTSNKAYTLKSGETVQLKAKVSSPKKGAQKPYWISKNPKVATVTKNGLVKAVSAGSTTVIGQSGNKKVSVTISVQEKQSDNKNETSSDSKKEDDNKTQEQNHSQNSKPEDTKKDPAEKPDDSTKPQKPLEDDGICSRGEWIQTLVEKFGYVANPEGIRKNADSNEKIYTFPDTYDYADVMSIEAAVQNGIISDVMLSRMIAFEPDKAATKEFVAATTVNALRLIGSGNLNVEDIDECQYPAEDAVAVEKELVSVSDNTFAPNQKMERTACEEVLAKAEQLNVNSSVDENHEDVVVYKDCVTDLSSEEVSYSVSANEINGELKAVLNLDLQETYSSGDYLVLPANDVFEEGSVFKIVDVIENEGSQAYIVTLPNSIWDVVDQIDLEGIANEFSFTPDADTDIVVSQNSAELAAETATYEGTFNFSHSLSFEPEMENDKMPQLNGSFTPNNLKYCVKMSGENDLQRLYVDLDYDITYAISYGVEAGKDWEIGKKEKEDTLDKDIKLGTLGVPLGSTGFSISLDLFFKLAASGSIEISYTVNSHRGLDLDLENSNFRVIRDNAGKDFSGVINAEGSACFEISLNLNFMKKAFEFFAKIFNSEDEAKSLYGLSFEIGAKASASVSLQGVGQPNCTDVAIYMYMTLNLLDDDCVIADLLGSIFETLSIETSIELMNEENSILKKSWHFEYFKPVDVCTMESNIRTVTVYDENKKPIEGARVLVERKGYYSNILTDANGSMRFMHSDDDSDIITVSYKGYLIAQRIYGSNEKHQVEIQLTPDDSYSEAFSVDMELFKNDINGAKSIKSETITGLRWTMFENGLLLITGSQDTLTKEQINLFASPWLQYAQDIKKVIVYADHVQTLAGWFIGCSNMESIEFRNMTNAHIKNISVLFYNCHALKSVDMSSFSLAENLAMKQTFYECNQLEVVKLPTDLCVGTTMNYCFAYCSSLKQITIKGHSLENKVVDFANCFYKCSSLEKVDMSSIFVTCGNGNLDASSMFYDCKELTNVKLFGLTTVGNYLFNGTVNMFGNCEKLTAIDFSGWRNVRIKGLDWMFHNCKALVTVDLTSLITAKEYASNLTCTGFDGTSRLKKIYITKRLKNLEDDRIVYVR